MLTCATVTSRSLSAATLLTGSTHDRRTDATESPNLRAVTMVVASTTQGADYARSKRNCVELRWLSLVVAMEAMHIGGVKSDIAYAYR